MVAIVKQFADDILFPSGDGNPMAENTTQYKWIVTIKENLETLLSSNPNVFVAADLLWYPVKVKGFPVPSQAPDVMVAFGRTKAERRSYRQWLENDIPPQVVFEILSDSNKTTEGESRMSAKFEFYEHYGVEEYYIYDPDEFHLEVWQRNSQGRLSIIAANDLNEWISPRLGIRFHLPEAQELQIFHPDRSRFMTFSELDRQLQQTEERLEQAERSLVTERARADALAQKLKELGIEL
jgi:Uma2 family endonuclease